ncbi:uncharacterized protein LOC135395309 [Ornithodoros turicata]|uniref:uncharacterized protein LOC135395309 n=1 Tax=Ornithodoros turicata TaxID=34597 RepID=UPI00313A4171
MSESSFQDRKVLALEKNFKDVQASTIKKMRTRMLGLCDGMELKALVNGIKKRPKLSLEIFFSAKTHKPGCPLRSIVSERSTWQEVVSRYLQRHLSEVDLPDPFLVRGSSEVIEGIRAFEKGGVSLMSIDIEDLYYSIPHEPLFRITRDRIEAHGSVKFQNSCGTTVDGFLELLKCYLSSTIVTDGAGFYVQKKGICIGSSVAPVLSDVFLTEVDSQVSGVLPTVVGVKRAFRYVDDYLVLLPLDALGEVHVCEDRARQVTDVFHRFGVGLKFTSEVAVEGVLRFLDLRLWSSKDHLCWGFSPRSKKALLPFESGHSKIVKRGIVRSCMVAALNKSCLHKVAEAYTQQCDRILQNGYPVSLLQSVCDKLLRGFKCQTVTDQEGESRRKKFLVVPYVHSLSHNLKKVGERFGVNVLFSAPFKLSKLSAIVKSPARKPICDVKHVKPFVSCRLGVIYSIPLSCGRCYIGQTGRCVNIRLREHASSLGGTPSGHLALHCSRCVCNPMFQDTVVVAVSSNALTRELVEAYAISKMGVKCVSQASVTLSEREIFFLDSSGWRPLIAVWDDPD